MATPAAAIQEGSISGKVEGTTIDNDTNVDNDNDDENDNNDNDNDNDKEAI